ncbi:dihydrolipoamide acetyltransferase [Thelephora terrestris]|uniref:Acetyltransferase component of pyruvate dehydrogenase complex n=1 Tax=Thelephora terrestris TaxID=56493 RepID=A0A9P6HKD5_9AGAM|nr:dihydrolipoamide acetyltransferase [Thelephora terrestris]
MASQFARILSRQIHGSARRNALSKFTMPAMSPTMTEGGIAQWKVKEGQKYSAGDVLLEIETDKATIDVEAPEDGILAKIISADGSKGVAVGFPIAIVGEEGDDISGADALASEASKPEPQSTKAEEIPPEPKETPKEESKPTPTPTPSKAELRTGDIIFATPIAKKIALERGIPLAKVKGTGPNGRIIREDVEKFKPSTESVGASTSQPAAATSEFTDIPLTNMRRTIGSRLTEAKRDRPHYYLTVDIDMGKVLKLREVFNKSLAEKDKGVKLSVNDFIVKAVGLALADVPEANTSWMGEYIRQWKKADISIAVATPTGLITPIVTDVGSKGLTTISADTKALAKKARDGKLQPQEYQGGSFTVSNLGMFGISHFTAIINPPQSCILAVGATVPTLVPAPETEKGFKTAQIMKATLSSDHRTVDGAVGARWMAAFKGYLENPLTFML